MGFRIVAWMERSGIQEGGVWGVAEATVCVSEETRITLCSIRATKGNPSIFMSCGQAQAHDTLRGKSYLLCG
jgi:hypothetical protein